MSGRALTPVMMLVSLLTALNIAALIVNLSQPSRAVGAGMSYQDLLRDQEFTRAVKTVVQECRVNVDIAKLSC